MRLADRPFPACLLVFVLCLWGGCSEHQDQYTPDGRLILTYWEKWTGFEAQAMQQIVDDYNQSQQKVYVKMLNVSQIDQKLLLAAAGGNPPDIAGLWSHTINIYAEKSALTPLNNHLEARHIGKEKYVPVFWDLCSHRGYVWGLPSTPSTMALHWNQRLFAEAGLDPQKPPQTIAQLDQMAEQLTLVNVIRDGKSLQVRYPQLTVEEKQAKRFEIVQLGFTPSVPGWWNEMWGFWFDGELWDGENRIQSDHPGNLAAYEWMAGYYQKFGVENLMKFGSSFGNFASPQSPFFSERVAMVLQGTWNFNFIQQYAPQLQWAAAAFPSWEQTDGKPVSIVETDVLVIPRGVRHVREALDFICYVNQQPVMEKLAMGQRKFSPLATVSPTFYQQHPNPYIKVFAQLAQSPNVRYVPRMTIWQEDKDEMVVAIDQLGRLEVSPQQAMDNVQKRVQRKLDRAQRRWDRVEIQRISDWQKVMSDDTQ